eukprot:g11249.t1
MSKVEQPLVVLAPSSDADEGLLRQGSRSSTRPPSSAYGIEDKHIEHGVVGADAGRDLSTSLTSSSSRKDPTELSSQQKKAPEGKHASPTVYKELGPLVAMPPPCDAAVHSRLAKHGYSRLGRNLLFEARPAVVHFGGYELGKPHSQRVRVVNISRTSQRLHILGPTTDCFKVMNDVVFPTRLDFGVHALGETIRHTVKMVCKVPIQFEFQIRVTKSHPHFKVGPLRGIVPANGAAQFNFTPIECVVTGAGRPGVVREAALSSAASDLAKDGTLANSIGTALSSHARAQERKLRGQRAREQVHRRQRHRRKGSRYQRDDGPAASASNQVGRARDAARIGREDDVGGSDGGGGADDWAGEWGSGTEKMDKAAAAASADYGGYRGWEGSTFEHDRRLGEEEQQGSAGKREGADLVDTWATRPPSAEQHPYHTGKGSGAVFDVGGEWLAGEKRACSKPPVEPWAPPTEGSAFGSAVGGPAKTTVVKGLPGKLKPKDLKEAIRRTRADRQRQLEEQEALRALTASATAGNKNDDGGGGNDAGDPLQGPGYAKTSAAANGEEGAGDGATGLPTQQQPAQLCGRAICAYEATVFGVGGGGAAGGGEGATRQLKEMSFLQDLADTEAAERERSFKASSISIVEHVGEPLLTPREIAKALEERRRGQRCLQRRRREAERGALETCLKGPGEIGARCAKASLLLTGDGMQGVGFRHEPDWDMYKNDDWGRRREVLRRLVNAVGTWITRRRAGRRLAAIQARLVGLDDRADVAAMVERDNHEAKLTAGPPAGASHVSWKSSTAKEPSSANGEDSTWEFPNLLSTSEELAAEMLSESMAMASAAARAGTFRLGVATMHCGSGAGVGGGYYRRSSSMPVPPPPEFSLAAGDVDLHRFPIYDEGAALSRREEAPRDEEEETDLSTDGRKASGSGATPAAGWRQALSSTERRASEATLGRRRSSVGLRMNPATMEDIEEAWLPAAEAELTALAAKAEKVERMPETLLLRPPPPCGVDLITPDPRYKPFLAELSADEASPEWCLRPQAIPWEVPATKGLLLGYAPGTTTLRAYADSPRLYQHWRPKRERRSSGLACMKGQASRGVWQPIRAAPPARSRQCRESRESRGGERAVDGVGSTCSIMATCGGGVVGGDSGGDGGERGAKFRLAAGHAVAAAAAGDALSDSESDDEEDDTPMPTPADARKVFDNTAAGGQVGEGPSTGSSSDGGDSAQLAEGSGRKDARGNKGFARDDAAAALEGQRRAMRIQDAERLADRMHAIGAEIRNTKHAFVLQTPFHRIRSRELEGT